MTKPLTQLLDNILRYAWLIPSILAILCFLNTLGHGFVYDDIYTILHSQPVLQDWSSENLRSVFTTDIWTFLAKGSNALIGTYYYRPMLAIYWMVTCAFANGTPWKWHLISVLLHAMTATLVYQTVQMSLKALQNNNCSLALIAATVFAIHPVQTESVAWISASVNALTAIAILLSLMAYLKARQGNRWWLAASAALYSLALFTKESAIVLPLLLLTYELFLFDKLPSTSVWLRRAAIKSIPFVIVTSGYIAIRVWLKIPLTAQIISSDFPNAPVISRLFQLYTLPIVLLTYLKNILLPFSLKPFYPVSHIHSAGLFNFYLPMLAILVLAALATFTAMRSLTVRLGLVWLLVPLLPALEFRALMPECIVQDRYLYLSMIGAGLLLSQSVLWLNNHLTESQHQLRGSIKLILLTIFAVTAITTMKQNAIWADEWSYWGAAQHGFPSGCLPNKEMGRLCYSAELYTQAMEYYEKAKTACPYSAYVRSQLGAVYGRLGMLDKAEAENHQAVALLPSPDIAATSYYNLGLIYQIKGNKTQASKFFEKAIECNPNSGISLQARQNLEQIKKQ